MNPIRKKFKVSTASENYLNAFKTHLFRSLMSFNTFDNFDIDNKFTFFLILIYDLYNTTCKIMKKNGSVRRKTTNIRLSKSNSYNNKLSSSQNDPRSTWKTLNESITPKKNLKSKKLM